MAAAADALVVAEATGYLLLEEGLCCDDLTGDGAGDCDNLVVLYREAAPEEEEEDDAEFGRERPTDLIRASLISILRRFSSSNSSSLKI